MQILSHGTMHRLLPQKGDVKEKSVFSDIVTEETGPQAALGRAGALQCRYSHCSLSSANVNETWRVTADH